MKNSAYLLILIALSMLLETCSIGKDSIGKNSSNESFLYLELDIRDKSSYMFKTKRSVWLASQKEPVFQEVQQGFLLRSNLLNYSEVPRKSLK